MTFEIQQTDDLVCPICGEHFSTIEQAIRHVDIRHSNRFSNKLKAAFRQQNENRSSKASIVHNGTNNVCFCCKERFVNGWRYLDDDGEYVYLCDSCKYKIKPNNYVSRGVIIYTPFEQNKRKH